ncbi:MAG: COG3014 family protein [Alphaproteobacteria bacterium]
MDAVAKQVDSSNKRDVLLWRLEQGAIHQMAGEAYESNLAFDIAESLVDDYELQAKTKIGSEASAIFTNQASLPYRGKEFEKIMMNTYKATNFMALGEMENARVEFNRVYQRQRNAIEANARRIQEAEDIAEAAKSGKLKNKGKNANYNVDLAMRDRKLAAKTNNMLAAVDARILPYADYVNPYASLLEGIFFLHTAINQNDAERALGCFKRVSSMSPGTFIQEDYRLAESVAAGSSVDPVTYVIFATGSAPNLKELRIDLPLFLVSNVTYAGAALPQLEFQDHYVTHLTAQTSSGSSYTSQLVSCMDVIVSKEFKNDWSSVLTKTLISAGVKATAGYLAEQSVADQGWAAQLAVQIANASIQAASNRADLRTWTTLPKQFQYARIPTPSDGNLNLTIGTWSQSVKVKDNKTQILIVRSINPEIAPKITCITLN